MGETVSFGLLIVERASIIGERVHIICTIICSLFIISLQMAKDRKDTHPFTKKIPADGRYLRFQKDKYGCGEEHNPTPVFGPDEDVWFVFLL